jgi:ribonuclease E
MKKEMLINVLQPEECRIAIMEDGVLEELYVERTGHESYVGNIYKGRIVNIEPSIQAAFVDFGVGRNGFLHVSDVEPAYYRHLDKGRHDNGGPRPRGRDRHRGPAPERRERPSSRRDEADIESPSDFDGPETTNIGLVNESPLVMESAAEPVPGVEGEPGPSRRGGRGRSRRGRREEPTASEAPTAAESSATAAEQPAAPASRAQPPFSESLTPVQNPEPPPEAPGPRLMDSAERRTEEDNLPGDAVESRADASDADLFFPRAASEKEQLSISSELEAAPPIQPWTEEEVVREQHERGSEDETIEDFLGAQALDAETEAQEPGESPLLDFDEEEELPRPRRRVRDDRGGRRGGSRRGRGRTGNGRPGLGRPKPLIQDIFRRGQEVLVQVIKEGIGTKGPTLSTYISIAGRYLVLMPGLNRIGVSRKIVDEEQRRRLRDILHQLQPPRGLGFIIRTAGLDKTKKELQHDLAYLSRVWQVVVRRIRKFKTPAEIYKESDMITRTIRDTFTSEIDTIWVDEPAAFEHAQEFLQIVMPRYASRIKQYTDPEPLFHTYDIENEIVRIQQRHVPLPNGGSIVIDQTEALVAIDVNSGNFRADNNAEETAYQMNLLAAREIARQLRLRDLGGVIVNDFIDMREEKHRRNVERALREAVKRDRARTKILRISAFGLIEMTRQRIRPSLKRSVYQDCAHCRGTGQVKTCESMSIDVMRMLQLAAHHKNVVRIQVKVAEDVGHYLLNKKRKEITQLEEVGEIAVTITGVSGAAPESLDFVCYDNNNNEVKFYPQDEPKPRRR